MSDINDVLLYPLQKSPEYQDIVAALDGAAGNILVNGLLEGQKNHLTQTLFKDLSRQIMYVAGNDMEAKKLYELIQLAFKNKVCYLGSDEIFFYHLEAKDRKDEARRLEPFLRLLKGESMIIVTSVDAVLKKYLPPAVLKKKIVKFRTGQIVDIGELADTLVDYGYERVSKVEGFGQFSVRGGIVDIFTLGEEKPIRIEFFDDEISSIRAFEPFSQKSVSTKKSFTLTPSRMFVYPDDSDEGAERIKAETNKYTDEVIFKNIEKIKNREYFEGVDNYLDYLYPETDKSIFSYLKDNAISIVGDISRFKDRVDSMFRLFKDNYKTNLERGLALKSQGKMLYTSEELLYFAGERKVIINSLLAKPVNKWGIKKIVNFSSREIPVYNGKMEMLFEDIEKLVYRGYKVVIGANTADRAKKISEMLRENGIENTLSKDRKMEIKSSQVVVVSAPVRKGFIYSDFKYALITDNEILGVQRTGLKKKKKKSKKKALDPFIDLSPGDYVVHENSGIGRYVGIEQVAVGGIKRDYIKILYRGNDSLYVPIDQMDKVQKYIGADSETVKLNKLGTTEWTKAKTKVRREIEDMTKDLIDLYAKREKTKGHKFSKDTVWQSEFEAKFPYQETEDQLKAIKETKKDMESSKVMDRLVCGDVGYGKTEIAIRAVFKACMEGKQSVILVPTTILAQQHYNTFVERFKDYPVRIEVLSRFKSAKEQKEILEDVRKGLVDVIIATHRIVSKDVKFKNLGLLVIDEEQRFGVRHKESIKKLKSSVDVLTLSATPIPRTLHMSLSGIRDMSILEEPPQERYPVITYVVEARENIIKDEIEREIMRGGQVFFVYNRVETINEMAGKLKKLVPDARIAVAHGRMTSKALENTVFAFLDKEYDILVCTTIIETGMDIANANTMIIYDADKMGLSQLYQLRGRVGRSTRQGYAFLMYEKDKVLSEIAEKRLKAIKEFTEFGSGFKIAMRDLEIRGAGNLLGSQQHGHMAQIGYDLYVKMLNQAINKVKGIEVEEEFDTEVELSIDAYIPDSYVSDEITKIEMYKKIASIENLDDSLDIKDELVDRFGDIPKSTDCLVSIAYMKSLCKKLKIEKISQKNDTIELYPLTTISIPDKTNYQRVKDLEEILEHMVENIEKQKSSEDDGKNN